MHVNGIKTFSHPSSLVKKKKVIVKFVALEKFNMKTLTNSSYLGLQGESWTRKETEHNDTRAGQEPEFMWRRRIRQKKVRSNLSVQS